MELDDKDLDDLRSLPNPSLTLTYGPDELQAVDFWSARAPGSTAPLALFVHGGAWRNGDKKTDTGWRKVEFFLSLGYAFASVNYRLVPSVTVEDQVADVAQALKALMKRARELGILGHDVVLIGHSAGAHLACLLGTDESYLKAVDLSFAHIQTIIANDGAAYDPARHIEAVAPDWRIAFVEAFGQDSERQKRLSPTMRANGVNVSKFLLMHTFHPSGPQRAQTNGLADALRASGTAVEVRELDAPLLTGHQEINLRLGEPSYPATLWVQNWLTA